MTVVILGTIAIASPTIDFPLNSQVPPVARAEELFSYTFSSSTFSSTLPITYTLSRAPLWLSLNSSTRTLSGTPSANDVGSDTVTGVNIELTASDQSGSATLNATLVISKNPTPMASIPLSAQLPSFGAFSAPSTLLYHPSSTFKFNFEPGTFSPNGGNSSLFYYAVTNTNTPLPAWILFDSSSLTFSGQTPDYSSLVQPPQTFKILLIASDVEGFGAASISFEIEVGVHLLAFQNADMFLNATPGSEFSFSGLSNNLELDGKVVGVSSLVSITVQTAAWVVFDSTTLLLGGNPPADATSSSVTVLAIDVYGDTANATIHIEMDTSIFNTSIGNINATTGSVLSFDLSSYLVNKSDTIMTAQLSPAVPWISFDPQTFILTGQVPTTIQSFQVGIRLDATSKMFQTSSSESFAIFITSGTSPLTTSSTVESHPSSTTALVSSTSGIQGIVESTAAIPHRGLSKATIAAIVTPIGLVVMLIALFLAMFCCLRRRRIAIKGLRVPAKSDLPAPVEPNSSVVEIMRATRVISPEPLQLDTSGFGQDHSSSNYDNSIPGRSNVSSKYMANIDRSSTKSNVDKSMRRSQTVSIMSGALPPDSTQTGTFASRKRSYSESALSKSDRSWRSTQDGSYLDTGSRTNSSQMLTRNYSNYSRKGHTRRSGRVWSNEALQDGEISAQPDRATILNLTDKNFSVKSLNNFSALSNRDSIPEHRDASPCIEQLASGKMARRNSRFAPPANRRSGIGHGGKDGLSNLVGENVKRRSIGHGQNWDTGNGLARDSRTWLTVNMEDQRKRRSDSSQLTENENVLIPADKLRTIKRVPQSPIAPLSARVSISSANSRPISRRTIGASPFFGGRSSSRASKRSPRKIRASFADSPTVPEEETMGDFENQIVNGPGEGSHTPRDPFGISYGAAREGTRQLRSYIQNRLVKTRTRSSMKSNDSRDSRFDSATGSIQSLHQSRSNGNLERSGLGTREGNDEYEDYLPDGHSEGSWETNESQRDSQPNAITYGTEDSLSESGAALVLPKAGSEVGPLRETQPGSSMLDIGTNARVRSGKGKRPMGVDTKGIGSVRARVEGAESDYTAYI